MSDVADVLMDSLLVEEWASKSALVLGTMSSAPLASCSCPHLGPLAGSVVSNLRYSQMILPTISFAHTVSDKRVRFWASGTARSECYI